MPITTYTEEEVAEIVGRTIASTQDATRKQVIDAVRAELARATRQRLTAREAAAYLRMGRARFDALVQERGVPYEDRGGSVGFVFNRADLDALAGGLASGA